MGLSRDHLTLHCWVEKEPGVRLSSDGSHGRKTGWGGVTDYCLPLLAEPWSWYLKLLAHYCQLLCFCHIFQVRSQTWIFCLGSWKRLPNEWEWPPFKFMVNTFSGLFPYNPSIYFYLSLVDSGSHSPVLLNYHHVHFSHFTSTLIREPMRPSEVSVFNMSALSL